MNVVKSAIAEFLGTFFFLSVILSTVTNASYGPIAVAVGLLAAIYFGASISGAHFNPAVSVMMFAKGKIGMDTMLLYIVAQILGGLLAFGLNTYFLSN